MPDATSLGMLMIHLGLILGVGANLVIIIRFIRNGKEKR